MIRGLFGNIPIGTIFYYLGAEFVKDHKRTIGNRVTNAFVPNTTRRVYFADTITVAYVPETVDIDEWAAA